ncbi:MAG: 16S rRNA (adenine(1518)-N(6)/adenine(1519)-N(6))-dimethyltransferase RsmA [Terriglobia bacterium]
MGATMAAKRRSRSRARRRRRRPPRGQHFLVAPGIRGQILGWLNCQPTDCWLEIGAGHGEMTLLLAEASGCVAAVEPDPKLAETLRQRLGGFSRARVIEGNILEISLGGLCRELNCARWRVYGNLPYYITSPILRHLFRAAEAITDIHVVVQREVAERLAARPRRRDYGYLSVLTQFHTKPEILQPIPRGAFRPPPQVESALVRLVPPGAQATLGVEEADAFLRFVQSCFRQKRKTLLNNLHPPYQSVQVKAALAAAGLSPRSRAEELSLEEFAQLHRFLSRARRLVVPSEPL